LLSEPDFLHNEIHTKWLDQLLARKRPAGATSDERSSADAAAIAATVYQATQTRKQSGALPSDADTSQSEAGKLSRWKLEGRRDQLDQTP
jgi:hypothetical protein